MGDESNRINTLFEAALKLEPEQRLAFLKEECGSDLELRKAVDSLLAAVSESNQASISATGEYDPGDVTSNYEEAGPGNSKSSVDPRDSIIAGRYKLVRLIGQGGMGAVYLANQSEPIKRQVALKVIKIGMDSKAVLVRFEAERQALALMDHPNIARIYDGGITPSGQPFFVMELVKGEPITQYCDKHRLSVEARLKLFVSVCNAIQHAHQKGIIHRDLKPGNVLVTEVDGRPAPKVIDFGVAKATESRLTEVSFNDTGAIVGTPAYMSPEQADPTSMDIDTRTDVYALGVILYELLVGSPPLEAKQLKLGAILEMLRMVREDEPPRPSSKLSTADALPSIAANRNIDPNKLTKILRGELDWMVMKAIEKDRSRRYETAIGFARDIERFLNDEVVEARPPSTGYRLQKFVRRHRGQVIAASLLFLSLCGGIVGTSLGLFRAELARLEEKKRVAERDTAIVKLDEALIEVKNAVEIANSRSADLKYQLGVSQMVLAAAAFENQDAKLALERLGKVPEEQRGWEWHYLNRQSIGGIHTLRGHVARSVHAAFTSQGQSILTGTLRGELKTWSADDGTLVRDVPAELKEVSSLVFSSDGTKIARGFEDGQVEWVDFESGRVLNRFNDHKGKVNCVAISPDGKRIASGGLDSTVKLRDAESGELLFDLKGYFIQVRNIAFSPDCRYIAAVSVGDVTISDTATGNIVKKLAALNLVLNATFSQDGKQIVTVSENGKVKVWDIDTGETVLEPKGHLGPATKVAYSPGGNRFATAGDDKVARVWDSKTGLLVVDLKGHLAPIQSISFSPDGGRIVTGSSDKTAKVWDTEMGTPYVEMISPVALSEIALNTAGTQIVAGTLTKSTLVWDAHTGRQSRELSDHVEMAEHAKFSPDGTRIFTTDNKTVKIWDAMTGNQIQVLSGLSDRISNVVVSPDGTLVAACSHDKTAKIWNVESATVVCDLVGHTDIVTSASFSGDGKRIVTGSVDGKPKIWNTETGALELELVGHTNWVWGVAFSKDGKKVATACSDSSARIWDAKSGTVLFELKGHTAPATSIEFNRDGTRLITGSFDSTARIWDAQTGTSLVELKMKSGRLIDAFFSVDNTKVYTSTDKVIKVWDGSRL